MAEIPLLWSSSEGEMAFSGYNLPKVRCETPFPSTKKAPTLLGYSKDSILLLLEILEYLLTKIIER
jgi:hypothetical protein